MNTFFFFVAPFVHRVEVRKFGVCVKTYCVRVRVGSLFFRSHRANQRTTEKSLWSLFCIVCRCVVLVILVVGFYFRSWVCVVVVFSLYFCSITFIFILPLFTHPSCSLERIEHTHTRTRVLNARFYVYCDFFFFFVFFQFRRCAMEFPKNINFILYSGLILFEKTNGSAKLFFSLFLSRSSFDTYMQRTQESNNLMLWRAFIEHWARNLFNLFFLLWTFDRSNWKITFRS